MLSKFVKVSRLNMTRSDIAADNKNDGDVAFVGVLRAHGLRRNDNDNDEEFLFLLLLKICFNVRG